MSRVSKFAFLFTLRQGAVYYRQDRGLSSPEPHYFIVLSRDNNRDADIVLSVVTSQVEKCKRRAKIWGRAPESLVEIAVGEHPNLTKPAIVDCNEVFIRSADHLHTTLDPAKGAAIAPLSDALLDRILAGVRASALPQDIKALILDDNEE